MSLHYQNIAGATLHCFNSTIKNPCKGLEHCVRGVHIRVFKKFLENYEKPMHGFQNYFAPKQAYLLVPFFFYKRFEIVSYNRRQF